MQLLAARLLQVVPVLGLLLVVVFALQALLPGDPARAIAGPRATEQQVQVVRAELGLDRPLPQRFVRYAESLGHLDLGRSNRSNLPVSTIVEQRAGVTIALLLGGMAMSIALSGPAAFLLALRPSSWPARLVERGLAVVLNCPSFWVGLMLATVVGLKLRLLPVGGLQPGVSGQVRSLILPSITIGLAIMPFLARSAATSLREVVASDYLMTARSVGGRGWFLIRRHMLRNALPPVVTLLGFQAGALLFGAVVVEQTFGLPGLGAEMITAAAQRDFPVVQGLTLLFGFGIVLCNLLADVAVACLDPRTQWS
ncbi:glutathione ABC transporter permease GsiC [Kribbella solani]